MDTRIRTLAACLELRRDVALVTVTAPGADLLPWDGTGRRVAAWHARAWNESAPERWSDLHRAASRAARREAARQGIGWRLLVKTWEYQKRGVLHLHLIVPYGDWRHRAASTVYVNELSRLARSRRFGFVDRGRLPERGARRSSRRLEPVSPERAATYVASYCASTGAGKEGVAEVARKQGVPGAIVYVARALTDRSGVTMRSLRDRRRIACRYPTAVGSDDAWRAACVLDGLERGCPPIAPEARRALLAVAIANRWDFTLQPSTGEVRGATRAPAPGLPARDHRRIHTGAVVGLLRLDPVPHGGHIGSDAQVLGSHSAGRYLTTGGGQEEQRARVTRRVRRAARSRIPDPSDWEAMMLRCPELTVSPS